MVEEILAKIPERHITPLVLGALYERALIALGKRSRTNAGLALLLQGLDTTIFSDEELDELETYPLHLLEKAGPVDTNGALIFVPAYISRKTLRGWLWQISQSIISM
jgi:hypothetical protein